MPFDGLAGAKKSPEDRDTGGRAVRREDFGELKECLIEN